MPSAGLSTLIVACTYYFIFTTCITHKRHFFALFLHICPLSILFWVHRLSLLRQIMLKLYRYSSSLKRAHLEKNISRRTQTELLRRKCIESHGNISILLSEAHEPSALRFSAKLHRLNLERVPPRAPNRQSSIK